MRRVVSFMHLSLDGYASGINREIDWILIDEEIFQYVYDRTKESDTALYGRITYELMESYWPTAASRPNATKHDMDHSKWYNSVSKIVASKTMKGAKLPNTTIISEFAAIFGDTANLKLTSIE